MARPASSLSINPLLRVLLMSPAKLGKTTIAVSTAPAPVRVILCEDDSALFPLQRDYPNVKFDISDVRSPSKGAFQEMLAAGLEAKNDAKAKKISTVIVDPISEFAHHLLEESFANNQTAGDKDNGMVAYGEFARRFDHVLDFLFTIPAHLIVISHYASESPELTGQLKKQGEGIVPLIPGKMRNRMGGKFGHILWLDIDPKDPDKRVFVTKPNGVWGPGGRFLKGVDIMPADFGEVIRLWMSKGVVTPKTTAAPVTQRPPLRPPPPMNRTAAGVKR